MDNDVLSTFEQHIYNTYLRVSKQRKKQPFKYRKDFTTLSADKIIALKRISTFLNKFKHIKVDDFINAPFAVYADEEFFELNYYTTLKATKAYSLLQKKKMMSDPDSVEQLMYIRDSLIFIKQFCVLNNINIDDYLLHKTGNINTFVLHLKEHNVNIYTLLGFTNFTKIFSTLDPSIVKFTLGDEIYNNIEHFKPKFFSSEKAIVLVQKGLNKIYGQLKENS